MQRRIRTQFNLGIALAISLPCYLFSAPDSGQILNQQKEPNRLPSQLPTSSTQEERDTLNGTPDLNVPVHRIEFEQLGELATETELQQLVADKIGHELSYTELLQLTHTITQHLRSKGYLLARAYLPKQEIKNGVLVIALLSGSADGLPVVEFSGNSKEEPSIVSKISMQGASDGLPLKTDELERSILLINDLPGFSARSLLERGERQGSTRVIMEVQAEDSVESIFSLDTFGNRYTGELQGVGRVAFNNIGNAADRLTLGLSASEGLRKGDISYSRPLGANGLIANVSYTGLEYELGGDYQDLAIEGTAHSFIADFVYPTIRTRKTSLWQGIGLGRKILEDDVLGEKLRDRKISTISTDFILQQFDRIAGGGMTTLSATLHGGKLELGVPFDKTADAATSQTEGSYTKLTYNLARLQNVTEQDRLFASVNGQFTNQNLDSSEKFILGGPNGVRAYPVGEGSGDDGLTFTAEWRHDLRADIFGSQLQLVSFYDAGYTELHKDQWTNSIKTATGDNCYWISGAGFGINISKPGSFMLRGSIARTIGDNAGRDVFGNNSDNRNDDTRIWLQTLFWF